MKPLKNTKTITFKEHFSEYPRTTKTYTAKIPAETDIHCVIDEVIDGLKALGFSEETIRNGFVERADAMD